MNRLAVLQPDRPTVDLNEPAHVAGLFGDVRAVDAQVDARGWKHLFSHYGLAGLIDLAKRRGGWPGSTTEETVAEAIVSEALGAGFDPVSGQIAAFGNDSEGDTRPLEPARAPAEEPVPRGGERSDD